MADGDDPQTQVFMAETLEACASFNMKRAARRVARLYDDALRPVGLRSTQLAILMGIGAQTTSNLSHLAERLGLSPSALTRALKPLTREGWVVVSQSGATSNARLTEDGVGLVERAFPYWERAQSQVAEMLDDDTSGFLRSVNKLNGASDHEPAEAD
ncbi:MAG: MarR family winged helix-turn-helix transcriptional regulator [Maricaulaceae bacterium]